MQRRVQVAQHEADGGVASEIVDVPFAIEWTGTAGAHGERKDRRAFDEVSVACRQVEGSDVRTCNRLE